MESLLTLHPEMQFAGLGGPQMRRIGGAPLLDWIGEAAVVGLWEVLKKYGYFKERFAETLASIDHFQPHVVILIDYPGFNLRMAKALRKAGYQGKIAYYISPQVWAWRQKRVRTIGQACDLILCLLPFEPAFYAEHGVRAEFVELRQVGGELNHVVRALQNGGHGR